MIALIAFQPLRALSTLYSRADKHTGKTFIYLNKSQTQKQGPKPDRAAHAIIPTTRRLKQVDHCEYEGSLDCRVTSRAGQLQKGSLSQTAENQ